MVDKSVGTAGTLRITDDGSTVRFYVLCSDPWTHIGSYRFAINGTWSEISLSAGFGSRLLGTRTYSSSTSVSLRQAATGTSGLGGAASVSAQIKRTPPPKPTAPFGLSVTRVSDARQTLNWSRHGGYSSQVVQRRVAVPFVSAWQQIASVNGTATTYTDRGTLSNRIYEYRVAARNAQGQSGWSGTAAVATTPVAPSGVSATRSGANIVVNASTVSSLATSHDVRDGSTVIASSVQLPYTHVSPNPAVTHTYTVRTHRRAGSTELTSAWSASSNAVQLVAPPNAPTGLAPNGGVVPSDADVAFTWVHNPVDSSDQTVFELRYREPGGAWTTLPGGMESTLTVPMVAGDVEWQVRTKGEHPDFSPWSSTAVFAVIDRPGVAVVSPEDEWDASTLPVEWSWFQPQDRPQSAWQAELVDDSGTVVADRSGTGAAATVTFAYRLTEGVWTVRVRAATGNMWSEWAEQSFTVTFHPPAHPLLDGEWDEAAGGVFLTVGIGESDDPDLRETAGVLVERSIDGEAWESVAETDIDASLIDWESWSYGDIHYRATAFTAEGAAAVTEIIVEARSGQLWLSGGVGFGVTARLPFNPGVQVTAGRERTVKQYAGRSLPVAYTGEVLSRVVAVSGVVEQRSDETATVDELVDLSQVDQDMFLFRDPDGRRIYGSIGQIDLPRQSAFVDDGGFNAGWGYSFTLTETEQK